MPDLVTSSQLAKELGVSAGAVRAWVREGKIVPSLTTAGGHARFDVEDVRRQLRALRSPRNDESPDA